MTAQDDIEVQNALSAAQVAQSAPLAQLVDDADEDWVKFQSDDPSFFLRAAGRVIRNYVGWHIYPNIQTTVTSIRLGSRGLIILPTRHLTQVDSLSMQDPRVNGENVDLPVQTVDPSDYTWNRAGYIQRKGWAFWAGWYYASYHYGNDPYYLPQWDTGLANCTFWHGYDTLPDDIKVVAFELAEQAMTVRTGNIKLIESPGGYRMQTSQNMGLTLNPEQMGRLANYKTGFTA